MIGRKRSVLLASSLYNGIEDTRLRYVMTILQDEEADPNTILPDRGISPFHFAIGNGSEAFAENVTKVLLQYGANPNVRSSEGLTPVHIAAAWGRTRLLHLLLLSGGDPWLEDKEMKNAFHYAYEEHHWNTLHLLKRFNRLDNAKTDDWVELCDPNPKFKLTLDKVVLYNRDVVLQYAADSPFVAPVKTATRSACTQTSPLDSVDRSSKVTCRLVPAQAEEKRSVVEKPESLLPVSSMKYISPVTPPGLSYRQRYKRNFPPPPKRGLKPVESTSLSFIEELKERQAAGLKQHLGQMCEVTTETMVIEDEVMVEVTPHCEEDIEAVESPTLNVSDYVSIETLFEPLLNASNNTKCPITTHDVDLFNRDLLSQSHDRQETLNCSEEIVACTSHVDRYSDESLISVIPCYDISSDNEEIVPSNDKAVECVAEYSNILNVENNMMEKVPPAIEEINVGHVAVCCEPRSESEIIEESLLPHANECRNSSPVSATIDLGFIFTDEVSVGDELNKSTNISSLDSLVSDDVGGNTGNCIPDMNKTYSICDDTEFISCEVVEGSVIELQMDRGNAASDKDELAGSDFHVSLMDTNSDCSKNVLNELDEEAQHVTGLIGCERQNVSETHRSLMANLVEFHNLRLVNCLLPLDTNYSAVNSLVDREIEEHKNELVGYEPHKEASLVRYKTLTELDQLDHLSVMSADIGEKVALLKLLRQQSEMVECNTKNETGMPDEAYSSDVVDHISDNGSRYGIQLVNAAVYENDDPCTDNVSFQNLSTSNDIQVIKETCDLNQDSSQPYVSCEESEDKALDESFNIKYSFERKKSLPFSAVGDITSISSTKSGDKQPSTSDHSSQGDKLVVAKKTQFDESGSSFPSDSGSYTSATEDYLYTDDEQGVVLLERRFLVPQSDNSERELSTESSSDNSIASYDTDTLLGELKKRGVNPGPIMPSTKRVYIKKLERLARESPLLIGKPTYSPELERTLRVENWQLDLAPYERLEVEIAAQFAAVDPTRRWREGVLKSSFCYLLLDPRITCNLPCRTDRLSPMKLWPSFLEAIFYVGKGKRSRPYSHLYQAAAVWKSGETTSDPKVQQILDIWKDGLGVVCLHIFLNVIPVEAYTREAAIIDALTLRNVRNARLSEYYGVAATWPTHLKNMLGVYLLYKAMGIFINEGERQLRPADLG